MDGTNPTNMLVDLVDLLGLPVVHAIKFAAGLVKSESAPGIVVILLVLLLIGAAFQYHRKMGRRLRAAREMEALVVEHEDIHSFAEGFDEFRQRVSEKKDTNDDWRSLWGAWEEFRETIVPDDLDGPTRLRNSIRPSSFINVEDLGFGPGIYRIFPNLFVSLGLFFTFLGLVAALAEFSSSMSDGEAMQAAMTQFMTIASAKFIMSLVGLLCSIIFNWQLRRRAGAVDAALHSLCFKIERRLVFVSLEDLGFRQLKAATEQREHLREIGFQMVAELSRPLEALPEKITKSISDRMDPIFERVGKLGTSNMEGLVGDLSSQLSTSVGNALNRASEALGEATDRIGDMVERMNSSNSQAGTGLQTALEQLATAVADMRSEVAASGETAANTMNEGAERLLAVMNDTLSGIRDNTAQGAQAMSEAANDLRSAAEGFREQIEAATAEGASAVQSRMEASSSQAEAAIGDAGKAVLDSFNVASAEIARLGTEMGSVVGDELLKRLEEVGNQLAEMAGAIEKSAAGAQSAATGISSGAQAIANASSSFGSASKEMIAASEPLRASHERIESSMRTLSSSVETVSETLMRNASMIAENARNTLETAQAALGNEREGIRNNLEATKAALGQLADEAEKLDQIDEMLGKALQQYREQLDAALGSAQDHIGQMRDTLAPGIDTLKSVVEQAESFMPAQARRS
ncbi:MAG: hypothetical protein R3D65_09550 [Zhengella sp.]|uniref:hypothetical protein n=1 Tax=Zhengella sp. TaxID=2282762 RepID=UPI003528E053